MRITREAFIATILITAVIFLLGYLPFKTELVKPIKQDLFDFDIYDLRFSGKHLHKQTRDTNIVLVEAGAGKKEIAEQLVLLNSMEPAIIGLDVLFESTSDSISDFLIRRAIAETPKVVLVTKWESDNKTLGRSYLADSALSSNEGYGNFISFDEYSVIRKYPAFRKLSGITYPAFTSRIVELFDQDKFSALQKRKKKAELINYSGNIESFTSFKADELQGDYLTTGQLKDKIKGKIVLLGFFRKEPPHVLEDLHYTPLNERVSGKSHPDMYGIVIHANILSMILSGKYLSQVSDLVSYLIAAAIVFFISFYLLKIYARQHKPKHGRLLIVQAICTVLVIFIFLWIFQQFNLKIQLLPIIIATAIGVELFELYRWFAKWMHKRVKYRTIFATKISKR